MKNIKFRAFATAGEEMSYFDKVIVATGELAEGNTWGMFFPSANGKIFLGGYSEPMQFTGLLDKNGNEIYEGDVVFVHNRGQFEVVYSVDGFGIRQGDRTYRLATYNDVIDTDNPRLGLYRIIGNIHENPEMVTP